ncbi:MAG TPA: chromate efflux transporter [Chitinophagales bacterium]|nr:chromate efflux transporter [Chitinophagales bacterium]HRK27239.1 chromate efflux transporter [Chitinophagales bacterium]
MVNKPTFKEALKFWFKLGFISFGGPAGQIAMMHDFLVDQKKWISNSKFLHALNYCMLLPGPEAQQLATYIGWLMHGVWGGLAAGILFVLPSMFILLALSIIYVTYSNIPIIYAMFNGLKPAVIAIVLLAVFKIIKKSLVTPLHYFLATASFIGIFIFNIPFPLIILATIAIAILVNLVIPARLEESHHASAKNQNIEADYYLNSHIVLPHTKFSTSRFWKQIIIALLIWALPLAAFYLSNTDFKFWQQLSLFFTKAAFVTFGGAYAVLPYVAQVSVEKFNWLTNLQMIDGLALGETTPGPLIMVLAFVGFMAGYHHFGNSIAMGTLGLAVTTFYTFLPCFLFIFAGAPLIEQTQSNKKVKAALMLVTAAVVGVIVNLALYLGKAVFFPDVFAISGFEYIAFIWTVISLFALYRFKLNILIWILVSAIFGLVHYLIIH